MRAVEVSESVTEAADSAKDFVGSITVNRISAKDWTTFIFVSKLNTPIEFLIDRNFTFPSVYAQQGHFKRDVCNSGPN